MSSTQPLLRRLSGRPSPLPPAAYMLLLLGLSSLPGAAPLDQPEASSLLDWVPPQLQNLLHVPVYAGLAFLWHRYLAAHQRSFAAALGALLIAIGFGTVDELYQTFIPGRFGSLTDVLSNAVGVSFGVLLSWWLDRTMAERKHGEGIDRLRNDRRTDGENRSAHRRHSPSPRP